ncbi:hypothetical protein SAMN05216386_2361 [Nitrosospira briensis]|uniref:Uncharacterized protein n=1 Tax=Nitrosospira briensis TaxID=35799 RepID=A0A1I5DR27_9PROT|nr:hypothetical protein SAMN05216386_2361 [Nitrosospira briensis]SFO36263.1 hypothetical protein SAMN05216332_11210 [Nitrosospira briensis]
MNSTLSKLRREDQVAPPYSLKQLPEPTASPIRRNLINAFNECVIHLFKMH